MIQQRILAGDFVYYPQHDTQPHVVHQAENNRLCIKVHNGEVYFNQDGKIGESHNAPSVFIASPATQNKLNQFYREEFAIPYKDLTVPEVLGLLFDKQKYVLLKIENGTYSPCVYTVSRTPYPLAKNSELYVRVHHGDLWDMPVTDTGTMYPIDPLGNRITMGKPAW